MNKKQFITVRTDKSNRNIDLQIPFDEPLENIFPDILKALHFPLEKCNDFTLNTEHNSSLNMKLSLQDQGIENFETVFLVANKLSTSKNSDSVSQRKVNSDHKSSPNILLDYVDNAISHPALLSNAGYIFELDTFPALIGRKSDDFIPSVDLTEIDKNMLSSRKHAQIFMENKTHIIQPFHTTNGTFINNVQIPPDEMHPLVEGDLIQFGFRGVVLTFKLPN